ncbi:DUF916 and DUF3324 domain-containing protein [Enterococcus hirae]
MLKKVQSIILCFMFMGIGTWKVQADEIMGGYTIECIPNVHQIDTSLGYFYLCEQPGAQDHLGIKLINSSNQEKRLTVKVTNANTNANGLLDYTGTIKDNKDLKLPLTSIVKATQSEVTVPAKSEVDTSFTVKLPKEKFTGVVVGGIVVSEKAEKTPKAQKKEVSIENTYNYTLGVVLTNNAKTKMKQPISVSLEKVAPILSDGRKIIQADILNPNSYIFDQATVAGEILEKSTDKVIKKQQRTNVNIAPHSVYPFQFDWKKDELKAGDYIFTGSVKAGGKEWLFSKEFTINPTTAQDINERSLYHVVVPQWLQISWIILFLVNVAGISYLIIRYKKN